MNFIDFHVDTLYRLFYRAKGEVGDLWKNNCHIDLEREIASGYTAQLFACFLDLAEKPKLGSSYEDVLGMIELFYQQISADKEKVGFAGNYAQYKENKEQGKLSAFLSLEEGGVLEGDLKRLNVLYDKGVWVMNLTWNHENCLAYPHRPAEFQNKGLKPFGLEIVQRMDELGMVVDVSHLSDAGFWDVVKHGTRPFMATHSNSREVRNVSRNLSDEMIRALADRGGIMGLNFYSDFLSDDPVGRIDDMLRHCRHIMNVGGEQVLGLGTDFDGMETEIEVNGAGEMPKLAQAMDRAGFSTDQIEGICYRNAERFFARYWGEK